MRLVKAIIFLLVSSTFYTCSVNQWDVDSYISKFERNRKDFERLVYLLKGSNLKAGPPINENELSKNIQIILKNLDVVDVNLIVRCQGITEYQFTTSWSNNATVYFTKQSCDKEQVVKGYHAKKSEMIEVWGLGNDWTMWIDYDFI